MRTVLLKHETYLITKTYCGTKIEHTKIILIAGDCYTAHSNVFFFFQGLIYAAFKQIII